MTVRTASIPHLRSTDGGTKQLIVNGSPFLILGAELQNSSMTSASFMQSVWPKLTAAHINTALGCVTWEQIEPKEGKFDFTELDQVLQDAGAHGMKLILLWFGSFKNGLSTYTPAWVKLNTRRFPRAQLRKAGGRLETGDVLSIFGTEAQKADAKAFATFMEHLRAVDKQQTVIMVQVENEVGLLGDSRDGSALANERFAQPVPTELVDRLHRSWDVLHPELKANLKHFQDRSKTATDAAKNWVETFGDSPQTDELFMAYHYATYVEQVVAAGKAAYPLPLYTNVWQNYVGEDGENAFPTVVGGGGAPGDYPSGGGVINVIDIWQEFAPSLDIISPDVYLNDYASSCLKYRHRGNPLFIPEQRRDEYGARRIWVAYGTHAALGCSPFGIDTLSPSANPYARHYALLSRVAGHVLAAQATSHVSSYGFFFDELTEDGRDPSPPQRVTLGNFELTIARSFVFGRPAAGFGMVVHLSDASATRSRYLLVGFGFMVTFRYVDARASFAGILAFEEKEVVGLSVGEKDRNGNGMGKMGEMGLRTVRMLNGDETRSGKHVVMPSEEPDYGDFPICVTIPGRTGIAECEAYALVDEE